MQPIILLGVAVAAVALVSTGFLAEPWNQFELFVQQLGWGENTIASPVSSASVDLEIKKLLNFGEDGKKGTADDYYDNVISDCSFHSVTTIDPLPTTTQGARDGLIICKILGEVQPNVFEAIAEGNIPIEWEKGYVGSTTPAILIPIDMCVDSANPEQKTPNCLDVQAEIHAVKIVVEAPIGQQ